MAIERKPLRGEFKKHMDILKNHEEHAKYKSVVDTAIKRLGEAKHPDAFPHIVKFLESKDEIYRFHAIKALGELGMEEALPHIVKYLESERWEYRFHAIKALENLGMEEALPHLAEHFRKCSDPKQDRFIDSKSEQIRILNAMLNINREKALPMIIEMHGEADAGRRNRIEKVLKKIEEGKDGN